MSPIVKLTKYARREPSLRQLLIFTEARPATRNISAKN